MTPRSLPDALRTAYARVRPFTCGVIDLPPGPVLTGYFCVQRERIAHMRTPVPIIGVPIMGTKEIWSGDQCQRFGPGEAFGIPSNVDLDVVNTPHPLTGRYETIIFVCPPRLMAPPFGTVKPPRDPARPMLIGCDDEIAGALERAALVLADKEEARELAELRMREVLLLLRNDPAVRAMFDNERTSQVANIVRTDLARKWGVADVAHALHVASSTLRRQLAGEGTSFRAILKRERMALAESMLTTGGASVTEAAEAAGYVSRSHFASRFKESYGAQPRSYLP